MKKTSNYMELFIVQYNAIYSTVIQTDEMRFFHLFIHSFVGSFVLVFSNGRFPNGIIRQIHHIFFMES